VHVFCLFLEWYLIALSNMFLMSVIGDQCAILLLCFFSLHVIFTSALQVEINSAMYSYRSCYYFCCSIALHKIFLLHFGSWASRVYHI